MNNASDYFSSLLGDAGKAAAPRRTTVVTPGTIARVREEQAADAFAAERARLQAEKDALQADLDAQRDAAESLATDLALAHEQTTAQDAALTALRARAAQAEADRAAARAELEALRAQSRQDEALAVDGAAKDREIARLQALLADAQRTALSASVLLEKPATLGEKFTGEIREHVLATLAAATDAAESGGRERRARILEAVLCANPPTGELDRRRQAVKQVIKDAGAFLDGAAIAALEKLGFRYITGKNHHKLDWAGVRFPLAKTPSDHRACQNSAAEIANRVF